MIGARHNYFKCVPMAEYSYDPSELRVRSDIDPTITLIVLTLYSACSVCQIHV